MQTVALREVRAASRRPMTYWGRSAAGAVGGAALFVLLIQMQFAGIGGRTLFMTSVTIAFLLCLFEGVRQASTSIVEERVEGTLGLLLLTKVRGAELLLGKFAALSFFALQTLLAVGPVVAMSLLLGGVSFGEACRAALALANTLVIAITTGLLISARSREPSRAMFGTFFTLVIAAIVLSLNGWPVAGWPGFVFQSLNPFTPVWHIGDLQYSQFRMEFWLSLLSTIAIAFLALWWSSRSVARHFATEKPRRARERVAVLSAEPREIKDEEPGYSYVEVTKARYKQGARWFKGNPIEWLCVRNLGLHGRAPLPLAIAAAAAGLIVLSGFYSFLIAPFLFLIVGFVYSAGASVTLARARQSGELELWLTTPLTVRDIVQGHINMARKFFLLPGLILLLAWCYRFYATIVLSAMSSMTVTAGGAAMAATPTMWPFLYLIISTILSLLGLFFATPYVAMWIALKTKTPAQATMRTFLLLWIAPWIIIGIPKILIFAPVAAVASHSVRRLLKNYGTLKRD